MSTPALQPPSPAPSAPPAYDDAIDVNTYPVVKPDEVASCNECILHERWQDTIVHRCTLKVSQ